MTPSPDIMKAAREMWRSLQTVSEHAWPEDAATTQDIERIATALQSERSSAAAEIERLRALVKDMVKVRAPIIREVEAWSGYSDSEPLVEGWTGGPASQLNVGHLRALAAFLDKLEGRFNV